MQKITPFIWYDGKAEEAAKHYTSIFKNSKIVSYMGQPGQAMGVTIEIEGQQFILFNGGPMFHFTPAISLFVNANTQEEIDELWEKLSEGGETERCGWLKDKYGLSWQIVPPVLSQLLQDKDRDKANRVMQAMLGMTKLDIKGLQEA
ncbi:MAG: VOC family protein [Chitinophagaceae bacterium]|nr:VOC family protein [Chitinophagaceae bacterium]